MIYIYTDRKIKRRIEIKILNKYRFKDEQKYR